MQMLPRSLPENLDDVVVQVALVRPGPIQGGAVHPYLERRKRAARGPRLPGPLRASGPRADPRRHARGDRLPGSGDPGGDGARRLYRRRGRGAAPGDEPQALRRGARTPTASASSPARSGAASTRALAERVFEQVRGFSGFGFPKSHAAAFGLLAYQSTWLRVHYGPELLCSLFNEQPMGFYPPDSLAHEAQRRGIEVRPVDVNASDVECSVEPRAEQRAGGPLSGLGYVKGIGEEEVRGAGRASACAAGPIATSPTSPRARPSAATGSSGSPGPAPASPSGSPAARRCAATNCGGWGSPAAAERHKAPQRRRGRLRLAALHAQLALPLPLPAPPELRPLDSWERIVADYSSTGVTLGEHPLEVMRPELGGGAGARPTSWTRIADGAPIAVAGMVVARQRPATAKGIVFMLLEDEVRRRQRDRATARLRALPAGGPHRVVRARRRPARAPRGRRQPARRRSVERLAAARGGAGAEVRTDRAPGRARDRRPRAQELPMAAAEVAAGPS